MSRPLPHFYDVVAPDAPDGPEVGPDLARALHQTLVDQHIEARRGPRRGQRVAAEGAAVVAGAEEAQHARWSASTAETDKAAAERPCPA